MQYSSPVHGQHDDRHITCHWMFGNCSDTAQNMSYKMSQYVWFCVLSVGRVTRKNLVLFALKKNNLKLRRNAAAVSVSLCEQVTSIGLWFPTGNL